MPAEPPVFRLHEGSLPLLVSMPHDGTAIPADLREDFRDSARKVPDTDWHISTLYDFAAALGASLLVPGYSRYVVDLNRPADGSAVPPMAARYIPDLSKPGCARSSVLPENRCTVPVANRTRKPWQRAASRGSAP